MGSDILSDGAAPLLATDLLDARADLLGESRDLICRKVLAGGPDLIYEVEGFDELLVIAPGDPGGTDRGVLATSPGDPAWDGPDAPLRLSRLRTVLSLGADHGCAMPRLVGVVLVGAGEEAATFGIEPSPRAISAARRAAAAAERILAATAARREVG